MFFKNAHLLYGALGLGQVASGGVRKHMHKITSSMIEKGHRTAQYCVLK
jgi:hypothetical protein